MTNKQPQQDYKIFDTDIHWSREGYMLDGELVNCPICHGKDKSPTKLIFDVGNSEKCVCRCHKDKDATDSPQNCDCKGTGYLLPKKGELLELWIDEERELAGVGLRKLQHMQKFHLTSDAVLKSVGDILKSSESLGFLAIPILNAGFFKEHNLSESSKIVEMEGYYEMS